MPLLQDPDVIAVGEMRDLETMSTAMTAAETGHLVLGTLHTTSAVKTLDRIIDALPGELREQTNARAIVGGFRDQAGTQAGAGMRVAGCTNMTVAGCVFAWNKASQGGAILADGYTQLNLTSCTFYENEATAGIGGSAFLLNLTPGVLLALGGELGSARRGTDSIEP